MMNCWKQLRDQIEQQHKSAQASSCCGSAGHAHVCWMSHHFCPQYSLPRRALNLLLCNDVPLTEGGLKKMHLTARQEEIASVLQLLLRAPVGCQTTQGTFHLYWIALCAAFGFETVHECSRRALYGNFSFVDSFCQVNQRLRGWGAKRWTVMQPSTQAVLGPLPYAADTAALQELALWSADAGIFIHPELEFRRKVTDYRDFTLKVKQGGFIQEYTPLVVVPAGCVLGFADPLNEDEKKDMMRGTASAAGVSVESKEFADKGGGDQQQQPLSAAEDACRYFFDSLGLIVNDCLVAANNPHSDRRFSFASQLLGGTRTLKNAPYLSDRDFANVAKSQPLAEALRQMVHNFVDNGPLSMKVERGLLQSSVSIALSHSTVLPARIKRGVDNYGGLLRGVGMEKLFCTDPYLREQMRPAAAADGNISDNDNEGTKDGGKKEITNSVGIIPWLHMLPHGGSKLNSVPLSFSAKEAAAAAPWIASRCSSSGATSEFMQRQMRNGFFVLVATEAIGPDEEVCTQMMAPLNPVRVSAMDFTTFSGKNRPQQQQQQQQQQRKKTAEELKEERDAQLAMQWELDQEYDEALAMWMVTTAAAPQQASEEPVPSAEARYTQSCVGEAVRQEMLAVQEDLEKKRLD